MRRLSLLLAVALFLAACGATPVAVTPTDTPAPPTVVPPTNTTAPTNTAEPTNTPTTGPTNTPEPTATPAALSVEEIADVLRPATVLVNVQFAETALDDAGEGGGTGVVYDKENGYIITNAHVVEGASSVEVVLANQTRGRPARIVGRSQCDDLAVLKVTNTEGLEEAVLGESSKAKVGGEVVALGYPGTLDQGTDLTVTNGTISKLNASYEEYESLIQTNANINPGNSGGPLVNRRGEVIGINTLASYSGGERQDGVNYAISISQAKPIIEQLEAGNNVLFTGMNLYANEFEDYFGTDEGLVVVGVQSGSPASQLGVEPADLLYEVEGRPVTTLKDVCQILRSHADGDQIKVEFLRGTLDQGSYLEGELTIGKPVAGGPKLTVVGETNGQDPPTEEDPTAVAEEPTATDDGISILFETDFSSPDDRFSTGDTENIHVAIEDGVYKAELLTTQRYLWLPVAGSEDAEDSFITTDVLIDGDEQSYAGLMLRYTEPEGVNNMYICLITNGGTYQCSRMVGGTPTSLASGSSDAIKPGEVNTITFGVIGNQFIFQVNEQDVADFTDETYTKGQVGFYIENFDNPLSVSFDNAGAGTFAK